MNDVNCTGNETYRVILKGLEFIAVVIARMLGSDVTECIMDILRFPLHYNAPLHLYSISFKKNCTSKFKKV